jgi:Bacterial Ig-like domain (group 3)/FG-GAP-like repeat
MNSCKRFRAPGSVASATVLFLFLSVCSVSGILAQSIENESQIGSHSGAAPFLVAPWFQLAYAPTSVAVGDLNQDGKPDLITTNSVSGKVAVFLGTGDGSFASGVEYAAGSLPASVVVADVDGDGRPDVIVCDESEGAIQVLLGIGNGKLQAAQSYAVGIKPAFLVTGDFNGDGKTDVAVAARSGETLAVLLNDGKGNLQKPVLSGLHKSPTSLSAADFNSDGHFDIALANSDGTISVLLGAGNGAFRVLPDIKVSSGSLSSIVSADLDRDGKIDLAVTEPGQKQVSVLLGEGNGGFAPPVSYPVGNNPVSVVAADVHGDGIDDLTVVNQGSNSFSVLSGNGDGTFKNSLDFVVGNGPVAAVTGDFNGDGHMDMAVINYASQTISVPLGNGDGTFQAARAYKAELAPRAVASADLNGDKRPDLVVINYCGSDATCSASGSAAVFLANENGAYQLSHIYALGEGPVSVALVDVDGDKIPDIVALNRGDKTISVLLGKGDGSFQQQMTYPLAESPLSVAIGDFNKDGKPDLAVLGDCGDAKCSQPGSLEILLGQVAGGFRSALSYAVGYAPVSLAVGDLNQDKNLDIVVANRCGTDVSCKSAGTATVLLGNANGKFIGSADIALGMSPTSIALGDLSGRGVLDMAVSRSSDNTVITLRSNGDGSFQAPAAYSAGNAPGSVVIADFNGDGKQDVAVANAVDSTVSVFFGKGDGTLNSSTPLSVGLGPESLIAVEGAQHGRSSLVTANGNSGSSNPGIDITVLANIAQPEDVGTTPSTTVLTPVPTPNPSLVNQAVTLTATVTGTVTGGAPTGSVTFLTAPNAIADCNGTASATVTTNTPGTIATVWTCQTSSLQAPSQSITAVYSGDPTYEASTSVAVTQTVNPLPATLVFDSFSPSPATVDESITLIGKIITTTSPIAPGGTVSYTVNGNVACAAVPVTIVSGEGSANCITQSLLASITTNTVSATYTPDKNFSVTASTGTAGGGVSVGKATLTTTVQSSVPTASVNQPVTLSATLQLPGVTGPPAPTQISGTVTFKQGSATLCTAAVNPFTGVAACPPLTFSAVTAPGGVTISAAYSGDANFLAGTPGTTNQVVVASPTKTTLSSSLNPSDVNDPVTFTATVAPTYSGTTVFKAGDTVVFTDTTAGITMCTEPVTTTGAVTPCAWTFTVTETHNVTATFNPAPSADANFSTSVSTAIAQKVNAAATTLIVSALPASATVNQSVVFSSTMTYASSGGAKPSGQVVYSDSLGTANFCTEPVSEGIVTACPAYTLLVAGTHAITAKFTPANNDFLPITSPISNLIVGATVTRVAFTAPTAISSTVDQLVTFSATVTPTIAGTTTPTGTVAFSYILAGVNTPLCSVSVATTTTTPITTSASCQAPFTATGSYTVTATYTTGDANFSAGSPVTQSQSVTASSTSVTFSVISPLPFVNQPVSFTATVQPTGALVSETYSGKTLALPSGSVTFTDATTTPAQQLCVSQIAANGTVTPCKASLLSAGTRNITAVYSSGDANFVGSTSSPTPQVVSPTATTISVASSLITSVATQSVTYTATLTPAFVGTTVPTVAPTFSLTQGGSTFPCAPGTSNVPTGGTSYTTTCSASFPAAVGGTISVTAAYAADPNFSNSSQTINQTVQNFNPVIEVVNSAQNTTTLGPLTLTQGSSNASDPFNARLLTLSLGGISGFGDSVTVSCSAPSGLSCSSVINPTSTTTGSLVISASATAPVGQSSVVLTFTDTTFNLLTHQATLVVNTVNLAPPATIPVVGSGLATFSLPAPVSTLSFGTISTVNSDGTYTPIPDSNPEATLGVSFSAITAATTGTASYQFTITSLTATTSQLAASHATFMAATLGVPVLLLMTLLPGARKRRKKWLSYLGMIILALAAMHSIGCSSGGFIPNQSTKARVGTYVIQIVDTQTNSTVAVVPLEIEQ